MSDTAGATREGIGRGCAVADTQHTHAPVTNARLFRISLSWRSRAPRLLVHGVSETHILSGRELLARSFSMLTPKAATSSSTTFLSARGTSSLTARTVKLSLCFTQHHAMKAYGGEWRYSSTHS